MKSDADVQQLAPYRNSNAEQFKIALADANVPQDADYWGFFFVVEDSQGRKRAFRVVVKRDFIPLFQQAKGFVVQEPLRTLHSHLDQVKDGRGPLFFPELGKGWEVY